MACLYQCGCVLIPQIAVNLWIIYSPMHKIILTFCFLSLTHFTLHNFLFATFPFWGFGFGFGFGFCMCSLWPMFLCPVYGAEPCHFDITTAVLVHAYDVLRSLSQWMSAGKECKWPFSSLCTKLRVHKYGPVVQIDATWIFTQIVTGSMFLHLYIKPYLHTYRNWCSCFHQCKFSCI